MFGEPLDRATHRYRSDDLTGSIVDGGAHRSHARLPFCDGRNPRFTAEFTEQHSAAGALIEGEDGAGGNDGAQPMGRLQRRKTHSGITLTHEQLGRLARLVAKTGKRGTGGLGKGPPGSCGLAEGDETGSEGEPAIDGATEEPVHLKGGGDAVRGGATQAGLFDQLGERCAIVGDRIQHRCGLVDDANATYTRVHIPKRMSHIVRTQPESPMSQPRTLSQKIWDRHVVTAGVGGAPDLLYIDLHLIHEVTSPQAFDGLRMNGRAVRRPDLTVATEDHNTPTENQDQPIEDETSAKQIATLRANTEAFGIVNYPMGHENNGIVHVMGPEQGLTQPGMTIVCGDSHTATHGAFGAIAFGIGTSEVEHVLATQTLPQAKPGTMAVTVNGELQPGVTPKDVILHIIGVIGTGGGIGKIIEYRGDVFEAMSMEGRMTVCNMSIEGGAKAGLVAPDDTTFDYMQGRPNAPTGDAWDAAVADWKTLETDEGAVFDEEVVIDAADIAPQVSWGTNPAQVMPIDGVIPGPDDFSDPNLANTAARALEYMGFEAGTPIKDISVDTVFIGSCTNSRIEDLRAAAAVAQGRQVADGIRTLVVPGSGLVRAQAEAEGLDEIFRAAGFDWREPGCSMCLAMNPDKLQPGERCASTSNRNFEGRQGRGGRTHLVSPAVAAATAIAGRFATPADLV